MIRSTKLRPIACLLTASLLLCACALPSAPQVSPLVKQSSAGETDQRLADAALSSGSDEMAISLYKKILLKAPDDLPAQLGLGAALQETNQLAEASIVYGHIEQSLPQQPDAELALARIDIRQHRLEAAIDRYRRLLKASPDELPALIGLAVAYDLQEQHDKAQTIYRQALKAHPERLELHNDLGLSLILGGNVKGGIAELMQIVDDPGAPPQARQNLALAYGLIGNNEAAERILQNTLPRSSVLGNLQYYQTLRQRLNAEAIPANGETAR